MSQRELLSIVSALVPSGLISHRSALDSGISYSGLVHLTGPVKRDFKLPGLTLKVIKGPGAAAGGYQNSYCAAGRRRLPVSDPAGAP